MSIIQKHNYEAYLLDYLEDNLSFKLTEELFEFLKQNPELDTLQNTVTLPTLNPESTKFSKKHSLKKESHEMNAIETSMIQEIEGLNSMDVSNSLHQTISTNPKLNLEYQTYKKTFLQGEAISYTKKKALKKETVFIAPFFYKIAASILLFLGMYFLFSHENPLKLDPTIVHLNNSPNKALPLAINNLEHKMDLTIQEYKHKVIKHPIVKEKNEKRALLATTLLPKAKQTFKKANLDTRNNSKESFKGNITEFSSSLKLAQANTKENSLQNDAIPTYDLNLKTIVEVIDEEIVQKVVQKENTPTYKTYSLKIGKFEMYSKRKKKNL